MRGVRSSKFRLRLPKRESASAEVGLDERHSAHLSRYSPATQYGSFRELSREPRRVTHPPKREPCSRARFHDRHDSIEQQMAGAHDFSDRRFSLQLLGDLRELAHRFIEHVEGQCVDEVKCLIAEIVATNETSAHECHLIRIPGGQGEVHVRDPRTHGLDVSLDDIAAVLDAAAFALSLVVEPITLEQCRRPGAMKEVRVELPIYAGREDL